MSKKQKNEPSPGPIAAAEPPTTPDPLAEAEKFRDLAMRTAADFDNFRKRAAREKEDSIRYANTSPLVICFRSSTISNSVLQRRNPHPTRVPSSRDSAWWPGNSAISSRPPASKKSRPKAQYSIPI